MRTLPGNWHANALPRGLSKAPHSAAPVTWFAARERLRHAAFDSIRSTLESFDPGHWPPLAALNDRARGISNYRAAPLRFVAPEDGAAADQHYELRIAQHGLIATRENWHDLFNAAVWLTFPRAKSAISEMHARLIEQRGAGELKQRSTQRDVLTLFDESGVIVVSDDPQLLELLRGFRWKELFWERRAALAQHLRIYLFGHALLEKMLTPYVGITAKALCLDASPGRLDDAATIENLDAHLAAQFLDPHNLASTRMLAPLPVLGLPGWHTHMQNAAFYDDRNYFRRGYTQQRKVQ